MKAIVIDDYGGVDQLHLRELPDPRPQADEVLVRVRAAGVNPVDWKIRQGQLRFILRPKFPFIPGGDIAGEVVSTGPEATEFKTGDPVVGFVELKRGGGYAELAVAKKTAVALKSPSLSFIKAASLPIAGCTAVCEIWANCRKAPTLSSLEEQVVSVTSPFRSPRRLEQRQAPPVDPQTLHLSNRSGPTMSLTIAARTSWPAWIALK